MTTIKQLLERMDALLCESEQRQLELPDGIVGFMEFTKGVLTQVHAHPEDFQLQLENPASPKDQPLKLYLIDAKRFPGYFEFVKDTLKKDLSKHDLVLLNFWKNGTAINTMAPIVVDGLKAEQIILHGPMDKIFTRIKFSDMETLFPYP